MKMRFLAGALGAALLCFGAPARAGDLDQGKQMMAAGDLAGAAAFFNRYAVEHAGDAANAPEALAMAGRILDVLADSLTGAAEKSCYWGKGGGSPECMQQQAAQMNARFGADAFRYEHAVTYIAYTGSHYREILAKHPKSAYAPEAEFVLLLRQLVGHPDTVLPKVKAFIAKHPKGEWNRKGLLLWARANEDTWYVHRKWSWVLFNDAISPEDLIIKAEPYRQEALRTYEKLLKEPGTFEGRAAAREYPILKENGEDNITYSIVNDSSPGTLSAWGIEQPSAPMQPVDRGAGSGPPSAKPAAPAKAVPEIRSGLPVVEPQVPVVASPPVPKKSKMTKPPTRWN